MAKRPIPPEASPADPVFAAIERHKEAWRVWTAAEPDGGELTRAGQALANAAYREEQDALAAVLSTTPTTIPELRAIIEYIHEVCDRGSMPEHALEFMPTILRSPVLALGAGLGKAFDDAWEVQRAIENTGSDNEVERAHDAASAIAQRILAEPAQTLDDLRTKARAYL